MDGALKDTLAQVATLAAVAIKPWWVIGSAAVALHGADTPVADVDVLIDVSDAEAVFAMAGIPVAPGSSDGRFRSTYFGRSTTQALAIEFMAGLHVRVFEAWVPITPETREASNGVFVPARAELAGLLRRFGREKDLVRARLIEPIS